MEFNEYLIICSNNIMNEKSIVKMKSTLKFIYNTPITTFILGTWVGVESKPTNISSLQTNKAGVLPA